jgi:hypothetical protein
MRTFHQAVARRWPALLGAAVVTVAVPFVAFATEEFGPSVFESFTTGTAVTILNSDPDRPGTALRAHSIVGNAIEADGKVGVDAHGTGPDGAGVRAHQISATGIDAASQNAIAIKADGKTIGVQARAKDVDQSVGVAVDADGNKIGVKATSFEVGVDASSQGTGVKSFGSINGLKAASTNGTGVDATGKTAVKAAGQTNGVAATAQDGVGVSGTGNGQFGVGVAATGTYAAVNATTLAGDGVQSSANGAGIGVNASSRDGLGVSGHSTNGLGAEFSGGKAPIRLAPAATPGAPTTGSHKRGELYVDSQGDLFLCTQDSVSGNAGKWRKVVLQP